MAELPTEIIDIIFEFIPSCGLHVSKKYDKAFTADAYITAKDILSYFRRHRTYFKKEQPMKAFDIATYNAHYNDINRLFALKKYRGSKMIIFLALIHDATDIEAVYFPKNVLKDLAEECKITDVYVEDILKKVRSRDELYNVQRMVPEPMIKKAYYEIMDSLEDTKVGDLTTRLLSDHFMDYAHDHKYFMGIDGLDYETFTNMMYSTKYMRLIRDDLIDTIPDDELRDALYEISSEICSFEQHIHR